MCISSLESYIRLYVLGSGLWEGDFNALLSIVKDFVVALARTNNTSETLEMY